MVQFGTDESMRTIPNLILIEPLGYLEFLSLMSTASLLITDSGGIQEETTFLKIPCLTLRENTERPITIEVGTNRLCGGNLDLLVSKGLEAVDGKSKGGAVPQLWDGKASERIAEILASEI